MFWVLDQNSKPHVLNKNYDCKVIVKNATTTLSKLLQIFIRLSPPPSSTRGKAGRNHLNEEITPLIPIGIGERYSQTVTI